MRGIGVDLIHIGRMAETLKRSGDLFLKRVFTDAEQKGGMEHPSRDRYFAAAFAAKEAVFKALGTDWEYGGDYLEIEISRGIHGEPLVELYGRMAEVSGKQSGGKILLSLSYDGDMAVAAAVLI